MLIENDFEHDDGHRQPDAPASPPPPPLVVIQYRNRGIPLMLIPPVLILAAVLGFQAHRRMIAASAPSSSYLPSSPRTRNGLPSPARRAPRRRPGASWRGPKSSATPALDPVAPPPPEPPAEPAAVPAPGPSPDVAIAEEDPMPPRPSRSTSTRRPPRRPPRPIPPRPARIRPRDRSLPHRLRSRR